MLETEFVNLKKPIQINFNNLIGLPTDNWLSLFWEKKTLARLSVTSLIDDLHFGIDFDRQRPGFI